jgi:hypothetical protein
VGYAALPLGITLGTLFGPKPADDPAELDEARSDETERRSFGDAPREDVLKARPPDAGDSPSDR